MSIQSKRTLGLEGARALSDLLKQVAKQQDEVVGAHLDVTYRCDLDCEHCYLDDKSGTREQPTSVWLRVLDELAALGRPALLWSGGEVFARTDFRTLLARAHTLGMTSRVKTHAGNVDDETAAFLAAHGVTALEVSVYSLTPAVHDAITRIPGSLERTLRGMEAARRAGLRVLVAVVAMQSNVAELESIDDFFFELGISVRFAIALHPDQSSLPSVDGLGLHFEQMVEAFAVSERAGMRRGVVPKPLADLNRDKPPCQAGRSGLYIAPSGEVWPCVTFPLVLGNVRTQPLATIWHRSPERAELQSWTNAGRDACTGCGAGGVCGYCPGEAHRRTGDYRKAPPAFHDRARARLIAHAEVLGLPTPTERLARTPETDGTLVEAIAPATPVRRAAPFAIRAGTVNRPATP